MELVRTELEEVVMRLFADVVRELVRLWADVMMLPEAEELEVVDDEELVVVEAA